MNSDNLYVHNIIHSYVLIYTYEWEHQGKINIQPCTGASSHYFSFHKPLMIELSDIGFLISDLIGSIFVGIATDVN